MVNIKPFRALRPVKELVSQVSSPPYDVIDSKEARTILNRNPYSFLQVIKPEITIEQENDLHSSQLATIAADNFQKLLEQNIFLEEKKKCLYLYQQDDGICKRIGLVACLTMDDYLKGVIKKHENINIKPFQEREEHIKHTGAHTGCVLIFYKSNQYIEGLLNQEMSSKNEIYSFESDDGIATICWRIEEKETIHSLVNIFQNIENLYIADGHHRAAAAVRVGQSLKSQRTPVMGKEDELDEEFMYFPAVLIPEEQMRILGYHRLVELPKGFVRKNFMESLEHLFLIEKKVPNRPFLPARRNEFGMCLEGQWYILALKNYVLNEYESDIVGQLDVSILQNRVLNPLLDIKDPRKSDRIEFIGGQNALEKIKQVSKKFSSITFTLFPTSTKEIIKISDRNLVMPPKSTWFEPKLRSGIFVHRFD